MQKHRQGNKPMKARQLKQQKPAKATHNLSVVSAEEETDSPDVASSSTEDPYLTGLIGESISMKVRQSSETINEHNFQTATSKKKFAEDDKEDDVACKVNIDEDLKADAIFQEVKSPDENSTAVQAETSQKPSYAAVVVGESEPTKEEAVENIKSYPDLEVDTGNDMADEDKAPAPPQTRPPTTPLVRHEDTYPDIAKEGEDIDFYVPKEGNQPFAQSHLNEDAGIDAIFKDVQSPTYIQMPSEHTEKNWQGEEGQQQQQKRAETPQAFLSPEPPQAVIKGEQVLDEDDRGHSYAAVAEEFLGSVQSRLSLFLSGAPEIFDLDRSAAKIDLFIAYLPWPLRMFVPCFVFAIVKYTLLWYLFVGRTCYHALSTAVKLYLFIALLPLRCLEKGLEWLFQFSVYITVWFLNRVPGGHKIPTALNGHVEK